MKVLILGGTGMLGHRLWVDLSSTYEVMATVRRPTPRINLPCFSGVDVLDFRTVESAFHEFHPEVVINCVGVIKQRTGISKQVAGSTDYLKSIELNSVLPHKLAQLCDSNHSRLIHVSTDCVFDGKKGNYADTDEPNSCDLYGRTRALGEINYTQNAVTLRTSLVGKSLETSSNLIDWFLSQRGKKITGFDLSLIHI